MFSISDFQSNLSESAASFSGKRYQVGRKLGQIVEKAGAAACGNSFIYTGAQALSNWLFLCHRKTRLLHWEFCGAAHQFPSAFRQKLLQFARFRAIIIIDYISA